MEQEIRARGVNFIYAKEYILKTHGEEFWKTLISKLPADTAKLWTSPLLSLSNYPFKEFKLMVYALNKELNSDDIQNTAALYAFIADRSLNTLYKVFFRMANPSFVLKNYPKLWDRFFTSGEVTVPVAEKNTAQIKFKLPEMFLDWLPGACYGFSKKAVEMAGGRDMKMKEMSKKMLDDGEYEIIYNLEWV